MSQDCLLSYNQFNSSYRQETSSHYNNILLKWYWCIVRIFILVMLIF